MWPQTDINCLLDDIIKNLYNDPRLSDLSIRLKDGTILHVHKLVLAARSKVWQVQFLSPSINHTANNTIANKNLNDSTDSHNATTTTITTNNNNPPLPELDWSDVDTEVTKSIFNWVYTGHFEIDLIFNDELYIFEVMKTARKYKLLLLVQLCERNLLGMANELGLEKIARLFKEGQANMNTTNDDGYTLLHMSIMKEDEKGTLYLLENNADITIRTPKHQTSLELAIRHKLASVVRQICQRDYDIKNSKCSNGEPALWYALTVGGENIASILVEYGCDTNCWQEDAAKFSQNLLHKALDKNDEKSACFLIRSGCDCNSPRKPLADGKGDEEAFDGQTPLHIACAWNLKQVVEVLLEHHADINAQDSEGRTPLHIAIINQNEEITNVLIAQEQLDLKLRDKYGQNAFATAMSTKNNRAATSILKREPHAAEKYDPKGRTFLHIAIQKNDFESVLFLLSVNVNVHSPVQDSSKFTPIHLAVQVGSEMILRNLLLAGANINDVTVQNQTALHIAASQDHHQLCQILLENNINYDMVDVDLNNALHLACLNGNLNSCRVLLTESRINATAMNLRGQNPLHLLAQHGKENASAILDIFMQCMQEYPINAQDGEGNTPLLLAYKNGSSNLCRTLIRHKACLGQSNRSGVNIFNAQVASRNLLYRLLDYLPQEPPWTDGDICLECTSKFGLTNRKHHCRHCGRILCAKCSPRELPIVKFDIPKPVRVCTVCAEVLTYGETHQG